MKKIKLLFLTRDFSTHVSRNTYYFIEKLWHLVDLVVWPNPGDINNILKLIKFIPDFILVNDTMPDFCPTVTGLSSIDIPKGMIMIDLHFDIDKRKKFISENNVKYLFPICRDAFKIYYPEYIDNVFWFPHFVNTDVFKDYGLPKDIDILMMGNISGEEYKFRRHILNVMQQEPGFVYHPHPGYKYSVNQDEYVGENYAKEINRAKIFITEDSIYHYPVKKYYEITACNTLLLAPTSKELEDLGFIPELNFVAINENNFLEKARYYLLHNKEREEIAYRGYEMVRSRHSAQRRAAEFSSILESILK
jgi:hypothetical protein